MNKLKLIKLVDKLINHLGIINFILWTSLLLLIIFLNINAGALKEIAVASTFIVVIDIGLDLLSNRSNNEKNKKVHR